MIIYLTMIEDEQERSKFEQLYYLYRQTMFYVANSILKDEHLAEDTVHQAFIKLVDHLEKIEDVESHKTKGFCVIIVKHIAIDLLRQKKKESLGIDIEYEEASEERVEEVVINKD